MKLKVALNFCLNNNSEKYVSRVIRMVYIYITNTN